MVERFLNSSNNNIDPPIPFTISAYFTISAKGGKSPNIGIKVY